MGGFLFKGRNKCDRVESNPGHLCLPQRPRLFQPLANRQSCRPVLLPRLRQRTETPRCAAAKGSLLQTPKTAPETSREAIESQFSPKREGNMVVLSVKSETPCLAVGYERADGSGPFLRSYDGRNYLGRAGFRLHDGGKNETQEPRDLIKLSTTKEVVDGKVMYHHTVSFDAERIGSLKLNVNGQKCLRYEIPHNITAEPKTAGKSAAQESVGNTVELPPVSSPSDTPAVDHKSALTDPPSKVAGAAKAEQSEPGEHVIDLSKPLELFRAAAKPEAEKQSSSPSKPVASDMPAEQSEKELPSPLDAVPDAPRTQAVEGTEVTGESALGKNLSSSPEEIKLEALDPAKSSSSTLPSEMARASTAQATAPNEDAKRETFVAARKRDFDKLLPEVALSLEKVMQNDAVAALAEKHHTLYVREKEGALVAGYKEGTVWHDVKLSSAELAECFNGLKAATSKRCDEGAEGENGIRAIDRPAVFSIRKVEKGNGDGVMYAAYCDGGVTVTHDPSKLAPWEAAALLHAGLPGESHRHPGGFSTSFDPTGKLIVESQNKLVRHDLRLKGASGESFDKAEFEINPETKVITAKKQE